MSKKTQQKRTFMIVVDESEEFSIAMHYAAHRAKKTGANLAMLYVIEPETFQLSLSVEELMHREKRTEAENALIKYSTQIKETYGISPIYYIENGDRLDCLYKILNNDKSISVLVLGASGDSAGPGPIISNLFEQASGRLLPIPVTIVPESLDIEKLDDFE
jgi:nucleotide-binding universal stress UspA family protein